MFNFFKKKDNQDTKNLESHLKSLTKFYDTSLSDTETSSYRKNGRYMFKTLTIKNLMEMAKEVSDQMVLTKAEVKFNLEKIDPHSQFKQTQS